MTSRPISLPILVIGAGAWGTAIAVHFAKRAAPGSVLLWGRDPKQVLAMQADRENKRYLPGHTFPSALTLMGDLSEAVSNWRRQSQAHHTQHPQAPLHGLMVVATPMSGLEETAKHLRTLLGAPQPGEGLIWLAKGLRRNRLPSQSATPLAAPADKLSWPHQIMETQCQGWPMGALTGPSFAQEVAAGLPVALTIASKNMEWARQVAQACHGGGMRIYASDDLIGVELGGAMKNVLAIAAGVGDGLALGANARAALLTRGLAEMARLGMAIGAQPQTFMGLATLGDLILTATGDLSRNRRVGLALARGEKLSTIVASLGHVAEGVASAPALLALAQSAGVEVPITESVCRLVAGEWSASQAIEHLMSRDPKDEHGQ